MALPTNNLKGFLGGLKSKIIEKGAPDPGQIAPKNLDSMIDSIPAGGGLVSPYFGQFTSNGFESIYNSRQFTHNGSFGYGLLTNDGGTIVVTISGVYTTLIRNITTATYELFSQLLQPGATIAHKFMGTSVSNDRVPLLIAPDFVVNGDTVTLTYNIPAGMATGARSIGNASNIICDLYPINGYNLILTPSATVSVVSNIIWTQYQGSSYTSLSSGSSTIMQGILSTSNIAFKQLATIKYTITSAGIVTTSANITNASITNMAQPVFVF